VFASHVVGQERPVSILDRLVRAERVPHSLLVYGPEGAGKAALALAFARRLHCDAGEDGPCDLCRGCRRTAALNHPDSAVLFPVPARVTGEAERKVFQGVMDDPSNYALPDETVTIPIGQIRDLQKRFTYGTFEGRWRTAVILHADRMRPEAGNALLKTLEEPPSRSLMVLTAPNPEALLPTIVSRCQLLKLSPLSVEDVGDTLISRTGLDADAARFIARTSSGNMRRALGMASTDVGDLQDRAYRFLAALIWEEESKTYAALEKLSRDRSNDAQRPSAFQVLDAAEVWLRDVLVVLHGNTDQVIHQDRLEDVRRLSEVFDIERLHRTVGKFEEIRQMAQRHVNLHTALVSLWRQVRAYAGGVQAETA
jgi:DNA polymerase-3 subunit delta'